MNKATMEPVEAAERRALSYFDERIIGARECRDILRELLPSLKRHAQSNLRIYQTELDRARYIIRELQEIFLLVYWQPEAGLRCTMYSWPNEVTVAIRGYAGTNSDAYIRLIEAMEKYLQYPWLRHDAIDASAISAILFFELSQVAPGNAVWAFVKWATGALRKSRVEAMSDAWKASLGGVIHASELKRRVVAAESQGASYPPILHSLIERAMDRGSGATIRTRPLGKHS